MLSILPSVDHSNPIDVQTPGNTFTESWPVYTMATPELHVNEENMCPKTTSIEALLLKPLKHPLMYTWCLWYGKNDKSKGWEDNLNNVQTFGYVEDFWCVYSHIKQPSEINLGSDYSIFKKDIKPAWEDPANQNGGRWIIPIEKRRDVQKYRSNETWLNLILLMLGANFEDHNDDVCGAMINVRPRADKISLWTTNAENSKAIQEIARIVRGHLFIPENGMYYQSHKLEANKQPHKK